MKKALPIGLFGLLMYHTLSYALVCAGLWWQAEADLSARLLVYRTTDSLIEFQIPLANPLQEAVSVARSTQEGFTYRGHFYDVVSLEIRRDTLHITALAIGRKRGAFWAHDLLAFLNDHTTGAADSSRRANRFLKLLLQEYSLHPRVIFWFLLPGHYQTVCFGEVWRGLLAREQPVDSPPPEA